jgi:hypothetical protein
MIPKFNVATACFSCSPSDLNWWRVNQFPARATEEFFQIMQSTIIKKIKTPRPLTQVTTSKPSTSGTLTLSLSEGRRGQAWKPPHKMMLFSPQNEVSPNSCMLLMQYLNLSKLNHLFWRPRNYLSKLYNSQRIRKKKFRGPCSLWSQNLVPKANIEFSLLKQRLMSTTLALDNFHARNWPTRPSDW